MSNAARAARTSSWLAQAQRAQRVRLIDPETFERSILPIPERGRKAQRADVLPFDWSNEGPSSSWSERVESLNAARTFGIGTPMQIRPEIRQVIVSPRRFLAWFNAANDKRSNIVPEDWRDAAVIAGNIAHDYPVGRRLTGSERAMLAHQGVNIGANVRYASPRWEYVATSPYVQPMPAPSVVPSYMVIRACYRPRMSERIRGKRSVSIPTSTQVVQASLTPQRKHEWSLALEGMGTVLLHNAGLPADRPDVWSKRHSKFLSTPDRVAYRGKVRYQRAQPCRYGAQRGHAASETAQRFTFAVDSQGIATATTQPVVELLTMMGEAVDHTAQIRMAWRGHRRVVLVIRAKRNERAKRTAVQSERQAQRAEVKAGKRGKAVGPWDLSERSLPKAVQSRDCADAVAVIERTLSAASERATITFSDGTKVSVLGANMVRRHGDQTYTVRSFARRAALAGLSLIEQ